jgi:hypothetical protein
MLPQSQKENPLKEYNPPVGIDLTKSQLELNHLNDVSAYRTPALSLTQWQGFVATQIRCLHENCASAMGGRNMERGPARGKNAPTLCFVPAIQPPEWP